MFLNAYEIYDAADDVLEGELFGLEDRLAAGAFNSEAESRSLLYMRDLIRDELAERRQALSVFDLLKDEFALEMGLLGDDADAELAARGGAGDARGREGVLPALVALTQQEWMGVAGPEQPPAGARAATATGFSQSPVRAAVLSVVPSSEASELAAEDSTAAAATESAEAAANQRTPKKATSQLKSLSVFEAAMAMFKEEKKKVSKAKKAQLTEGWGFQGKKPTPQKQPQPSQQTVAALKRPQVTTVTVGPSAAVPLVPKPSSAESIKTSSIRPRPTVRPPVTKASSAKESPSSAAPSSSTAAAAAAVQNLKRASGVASSSGRPAALAAPAPAQARKAAPSPLSRAESRARVNATTSSSASPAGQISRASTAAAATANAKPSKQPSSLATSSGFSSQKVSSAESMQLEQQQPQGSAVPPDLDPPVPPSEVSKETPSIGAVAAVSEPPQGRLSPTSEPVDEKPVENDALAEPIILIAESSQADSLPRSSQGSSIPEEEEGEDDESDTPVRRSYGQHPTDSQPASHLLQEIEEEAAASAQVDSDKDWVRPQSRIRSISSAEEDEEGDDISQAAGHPTALKVQMHQAGDPGEMDLAGRLASFHLDQGDGVRGWGDADEQRRQDNKLMRALRGASATEAVAHRDGPDPVDDEDGDLASVIQLHRKRQQQLAAHNAALAAAAADAKDGSMTERRDRDETSKTCASDDTSYSSLFGSLLTLFVSGTLLEDRVGQAQAYASRARELFTSYVDRFSVWTRLMQRCSRALKGTTATIANLTDEWTLLSKAKSKTGITPLPDDLDNLALASARVFKVRTTPDHPEVLEVVREAVRLIENDENDPWREDVEPDRYAEAAVASAGADGDDDLNLFAGGKAYEFLGEETDDLHPALKGALPPMNAVLRAQILSGGITQMSANSTTPMMAPQQSRFPLPNMWNLLWSWSSRGVGDIDDLLTWQKVNHYPDARQLTRKDLLAKNLYRLQRRIGFGPGPAPSSSPFAVMPTTYLLPQEYDMFARAFSEAAAGAELNLWIVKPTALSRGRGIHIVSSLPEVSFQEDQIIQRYIGRPMVVQGHKFDIRLYVLVTSFSPLEAFIYRQGFARFSYLPYDTSNVADLGVHLTNAAVQKKLGAGKGGVDKLPEEITGRDAIDGGSKIPLTRLWDLIEAEGLGSRDALWSRITDTVAVTLLAAQGKIKHHASCFELFGMDLIIDNKSKVWVLEVNASPSMSLDTPLDRLVKPRVVKDTIQLLDPLPFDREALASCLQSRLVKTQRSFLDGIQARTADEKNQLSLVIQKILAGGRPRQYGELPQKIGLYERIAPSRRLQNLARQTKPKN